MFNTSFSNKTQLKKKIFLFYFFGSNPVQCIFSFEPDRSGRNSGGMLHCSLKKTMAPLFVGFLSTRSSKVDVNMWHNHSWCEPYQYINCFWSITKQQYLWLRVNLTRSHNTEQHYIVLLMKPWDYQTGCN